VTEQVPAGVAGARVGQRAEVVQQGQVGVSAIELDGLVDRVLVEAFGQAVQVGVGHGAPRDWGRAGLTTVATQAPPGQGSPRPRRTRCTALTSVRASSRSVIDFTPRQWRMRRPCLVTPAASRRGRAEPLLMNCL